MNILYSFYVTCVSKAKRNQKKSQNQAQWFLMIVTHVNFLLFLLPSSSARIMIVIICFCVYFFTSGVNKNPICRLDVCVSVWKQSKHHNVVLISHKNRHARTFAHYRVLLYCWYTAVDGDDVYRYIDGWMNG